MNLLAVAVVGSLISTTVLHAEDATLKMRFVFDGDPPAAKQINFPAVVAAAGGPIIDERLLIDSESKGIRNVVVFLHTSRFGTTLDLPPYDSEKRRITIANGRFDPHILIARTGDTLEFFNQGPQKHNLDISFFVNPSRPFTLPPGQPIALRLAEAERGPIPIESPLLPWMRAYLVVLDHPFAAISDEKGTMSIDGLPANTDLVFRVYHEAGRIEHVRINGMSIDWNGSRFGLRLTPGLNDFGDVVVPGDAFHD